MARDASVGKMVSNTLFAIWAGYEVRKTPRREMAKKVGVTNTCLSTC